MLAVDPAGVTVLVVLLLPYRYALFDVVDDVATGVEGCAAVRGAHAHPHRELADLQCPDAVSAVGMLEPEAFAGFRQDAFAFAQRQRRKSLVLQALDGTAFVVIAHRAFKGDVAAAGRMTQGLLQPLRFQRQLVQAEAIHPPATGGRKATVSPSANGCCQSLNSSLTATRRNCGASVRPRSRCNCRYS